MKLKELLKSLTAFRWHSVFIKYMICISLALMLVLSIIFYSVTSGINARIAAREEKDVEVVSSKLANIIESTENHISIHIADLNSYVYQPFYTGTDVKAAEYITAANSLRYKLNDFKLTQSAISSIYVYALKSDYVIATESSYVNAGNYDTFIQKDIFDNYIHTEKTYSISEGASTPELCMIYPITVGGTDIAYVSYNIDLDYLRELSMFDTAVADGNNIIYPNTSRNINDYYPTYVPLFAGRLRLVFANEGFTTGIPWHYYMIFIILVIVFSVAAAYIISSILYYNINTIYLILRNTFDTGYHESEEEYLKQNEYSYVLNNIKQLIKKNTTLTGTLNENLIKLNNTKVHALSLQMSPHFLFNTLNLISTLALESTEESKRKIPQVVELLSQVLQVSLSTSEATCSLRDEIMYTKVYIDIQKYKYEDFGVNWNIPHEFYELDIIKFSLQPIVENAIHHGFALSNDRSISIDCTGDGSDYRITITNRGTLDKKRVREINEKINRDDTPQKSIGLWNTNQRIKLLFGKEYGCEFFSQDDITGVTITMPRHVNPERSN